MDVDEQANIDEICAQLDLSSSHLALAVSRALGIAILDVSDAIVTVIGFGTVDASKRRCALLVLDIACVGVADSDAACVDTPATRSAWWKSAAVCVYADEGGCVNVLQYRLYCDAAPSTSRTPTLQWSAQSLLLRLQHTLSDGSVHGGSLLVQGSVVSFGIPYPRTPTEPTINRERAINQIHNPASEHSTVLGSYELESDCLFVDEDMAVDAVPIVHQSSPPPQWPIVPEETKEKYDAELKCVQERFQSPNLGLYDEPLASEYGDDILRYMNETELETMPNPNYIQDQTEITWDSRRWLIDWLIRVHAHNMMPETLWLAVNIIDRFLGKRVVGEDRLQLVGVIALYIAAKYEETMFPRAVQIAEMSDYHYDREEVMKGERIVLETLDFRISTYFSPYAWLPRVSRADCDPSTQALCRFFMDVSLYDHRFLHVRPRLLAALGLYSARKVRGLPWDDACVFYSGFVAEYLEPGHQYLVEALKDPRFRQFWVYVKYSTSRFFMSSRVACFWAKDH